MNYAFQLVNLTKNYKEFQLGPLNMELEPGVVLGYVGPNGSGKTTTMHCMMNLIKPDSGRITIFGAENDPNKVDWKHDVGYVGDAHVFYEAVSCRDNLKMFSRFYPGWDHQWADELVRRFEIPLNKSAKELSAGNRVKLSLVTAMAYRPRLLILDEPTSHLDPLVRSEVLDVFYETMESEESAIFYSTHILTDIARLADKLSFLHNGQLTASMSTVDLLERWRKLSVRRHSLPDAIPGVERARSSDNDHELISSDFEVTMEYLKGQDITDIHVLRMSLEDISVEILRKVRDEALKKKGVRRMIADAGMIISLEIRYFRWLYGVALAAATGFGLVYSLTGMYRAFLEVGTVIQILLMISIAITLSMDKRERMLLQRPVAKRAVAWTISFPVILSGFVLLCLWILMATFATETPPMQFSPALVLILTFRFLVNSCVFILFGMAFDVIEKNVILGFILVTIFGATTGYLASVYWDEIYSTSGLVGKSDAIVGKLLLINLATLIALILVYSVYAVMIMRRKSYLNS